MGAPYSLYVTDMHLVWRDEPSAADINIAATELGLVDFDSHKIEYLSVQLESFFASIDSSDATIDADGATVRADNGCKVRFTVSDHLITLTVQLNKDVVWTMRARKCPAQVSCSFFLSLCLLGFANHSYLLFQVHQLRKAIAVKEQYTLYLEENYKTVNGTELMDKYKRQNPEERRVLDENFLDKFAENALHDYSKLVSAEGSDSCVMLAISDRETWKAGGLCDASNPGGPLGGSQEHRSVKRAHDEDEEEELKHKVKRENPGPAGASVKRENPRAAGAPATRSTSLRKRLQIGYIKRR